MASSPRRCTTDKVRLPQLSKAIDKLSMFDLKELVSELVNRNLSNGMYLGKAILKPVWWPRKTPWPYNMTFTKRELMMEAIEACYSFYSQEKLLAGPVNIDSTRSTRHTARLSAGSSRQPQASRSHSIKAVSNIDGSLSYVADNVLATKENQENNPQYSRKNPPTFEASVPQERSTYSKGGDLSAKSHDSPNLAQTAEDRLEIFICYFCEQEFSLRPQLQTHQKDCKLRPPELQIIGTPPRIRRQLYPSNMQEQSSVSGQSAARAAKPDFRSKPLDKTDFLHAFGLVTKTKASCMKERKTSKDIEILDVEEQVPQVPMSPQTPRSLMSQLSRDTSPPAILNRSLSLTKPKYDSDSESDKVDDEIRPHKTQKLFSIDLCSELGQRVKKHFDTLVEKTVREPEEHKEKHRDYEAYCHTPKKTNVREKLRDRTTQGYPVCFRKRPAKYTHKYCFNKSQKKERMIDIRTGLTSRARALKRMVKKCCVKLSRVSKEEIKKWSDRKSGYTFGFSHMKNGIPSRPVYMSNSDLHRLLSLTMSDGQTQAFNVQMQGGSGTTPISPSESKGSSSLSPTLVGPLVITPNKQSTQPVRLTSPSSVLHSLLTRPTGEQAYAGSYHHKPAQHHWPQVRPQLPPLQRVSHGPSTNNNHVISISSDEEEDEMAVPVNRKRPASPSQGAAPKRQRLEEKPTTLLFRCHLCNGALTCQQNARQVIQGHFASLHKVFNIDLVEHEDAKGNKVMSIVEVASPAPTPVKASPSTTHTPNTPTSLWQKTAVVDLTEDGEEEEDVIVNNSKHSNTVKPAAQPTVRPQNPPYRSIQAAQKPRNLQSSGSTPQSSPISSHASPMTRATRKLFDNTDAVKRPRRSGTQEPVAN